MDNDAGQGIGRLFPILASATLITALLAVVMGGVVRVTGSGLGCPDWPLCHGRILPPWELAPWLEYIHRLSAAVSGVFMLLTVIAAFKRYTTRDGVFLLAILAAVLLLVQATLGAFTVISELRPGIALIHTAVATSLVAVLTLIVTAAFNPPWLPSNVLQVAQYEKFRRLATMLAFGTFLLILSGAYVTRTGGATFACPDIPLCGPSIGSMVEIHWIHMAHRILAFLVAVSMMIALVRAVSLGNSGITKFTMVMSALLAIQVSLGIGNVVLDFPSELRALHLATAILFFTATMFLAGGLWHNTLVGENNPSTGRRGPSPYRAVQ